jgi:hypothetical protein
MGYCPYYSKDCPENAGCYLWHASSSSCGLVRQVNLLSQISTASVGTIKSLPSGDYRQVSGITYNPTTRKMKVLYKVV